MGKKGGRGMLGESKCNEMEAALVRKQVRDLIDAGVKAEDIAVVTPYNAQVSITFSFIYSSIPRLEAVSAISLPIIYGN